jgi:general secretion pathway protein K
MQKYVINKQSGAALLAVLIVAVVMVVLLGVATNTMQSRLLLAQQSKQKLQDQAQVYSKANQLIYLLATQRITAAGISQGINPQGLLRNKEGFWALPIIGDELRGDGEVTTEESGLRYSIQNEAGLIPINSSGQYWLKRWLQKVGYSVSEQSSFGDTLADYADPDNWRRPGGAEIADYKKRLSPQPANFLLQSCSELWKVNLWAAMLEQHPEMLSVCSLGRSAVLNLNVVPITLWQRYWPNSAAKITNQRLQGIWLQNAEDVLGIEPAFLNERDEYYTTLGGRYFRLKLSLNGAVKRFRVERGGRGLPPIILRMADDTYPRTE